MRQALRLVVVVVFAFSVAASLALLAGCYLSRDVQKGDPTAEWRRIEPAQGHR